MMKRRGAITMHAPTTLLAALLLVLLSLPSSIAAWTKRQDAHSKTIIAYYASWQWYDRDGLAAPPNLDHSKVTRYNFAFFQINSAGDIWGTDSWADAITLYGEFDWQTEGGPTYCSWDAPGEAPVCEAHHYETGLISQAHEAGVEVYPSIGGWTLSDPFPALAANPTARATFAANCVRLIEEYDFDGIDIDWEYPGYADHSGTPEDTVNYSLFLQAIRDALDDLGAKTGRFYGLTAALPCGPDLIDNIQIGVVKDILTEFNLMTYDFHGSWNAETGANAPLHDMPGSPEFSVDSCVKNWRAGGARDDQINIGLPFYGRSFAGPGLSGWGMTHSGYADTTTWSDDEGSPQYFNIVDKISQFTSVRDPVTMTQYAYNNVGFLSYDDERAICDKTEYAMDEGLNGYIIWEISGDLLRDLSTPLLDATNDRLNHPGVRCGDAPGGSDAGGSSSDATTITTTGGQWYPNQASLGAYCVNDGKQLEYYLAPDQIFPSAMACCQRVYAHESDCVHYSLNPGSDGGYVGGGNPWYPHPIGYCRNDGMQADHFIFDDALFSSAEACCDNIYSFDGTCLSNSLNPGGNGQWVNGVDKGKPWYPESKIGACVSDGKHKKKYIEDFHLYNSAEACCDAIYSYDSNCLSKSSSGGKDSNKERWYPEGNDCISETPVPSWIVTMFASQEECCKEHFGPYHKICGGGVFADADESTPNPTPLPTPLPTNKPNKAASPPSPPSPTPGRNQNYCGSTWEDAASQCGVSCYEGNDGPCGEDQTCFADVTGCPPVTGPSGQSGNANFNYCGTTWENADSTCSVPCYEGNDGPCEPLGQTCFADAYSCPPVTEPAPVQNSNVAYDANTYALKEWMFYPHYSDDGASPECRNDGNAPGWILKSMMKSSRFECCESYFFPSWSDECNDVHPFYPKFEEKSCVNDGNHPDYMAGDSWLTESVWKCCHNFFQHDSKDLQQCTGVPSCDNCENYGVTS